jgi:hypothetical protein
MDTMDNQQAKLSREFVAGLICGEGWFGLTAQKAPRLKTANGFTIRPRFAMQMDDTETMNLVVQSLQAWDLPVYIPHMSRKGIRVEAGGCKRVLRWLDFFLPVLTGTKKQAAEVVRDFIVMRMSKPQPSPYGPDEFAFVNKLRAINAGNGKRNILPREKASET